MAGLQQSRNVRVVEVPSTPLPSDPNGSVVWDSAIEVGRELALDAAGQPGPVLTALACLREEGGQVVLDHLVEDRPLGPAPLVAERCCASILGESDRVMDY